MTGHTSTAPNSSGYAATIADLVADANRILDNTPDPEWWNHNAREVIALAFADFDLVRICENANYNTPEWSAPRALLRHRTDPDRWLLIWSHGIELLPGRMSTMGQFFRFREETLGKNHFAYGTPVEVVEQVRRRYRHDSTLCWWLLRTFTDLAADLPTGTASHSGPGGHLDWDYDHAHHEPAWEPISTAAVTLGVQPGVWESLPLDEAVRAGFPGWVLVANTTDHHTLVLLRNGALDDYLLLSWWGEPVLGAGVGHQLVGGRSSRFVKASAVRSRRGTRTYFEDSAAALAPATMSWPDAPSCAWVLDAIASQVG
jgi:hypothetical protein